MEFLNPRIVHVVKNPLGFTLQVLKAFKANQGLLLAGAVAYYLLLSIVPLLILMVIALSHVIDEEVLLATLRRALEFVVPGEGKTMRCRVEGVPRPPRRDWLGAARHDAVFQPARLQGSRERDLGDFFAPRRRAPPAFHRVLLLPFGYIFFIGVVLFVGTFVLTDVTIGASQLEIFGRSWSLSGASHVVLYTVGFVTEILLISAIYYFMPVGRLSLRHALIGGASATLLWELIRHGLRWYFGTLSQVSVVYGSLTTAIIVLLSFEVAATVLLLGAQVIAEYERIDTGGKPPEPEPLHTDPA